MAPIFTRVLEGGRVRAADVVLEAGAGENRLGPLALQAAGPKGDLILTDASAAVVDHLSRLGQGVLSRLVASPLRLAPQRRSRLTELVDDRRSTVLLHGVQSSRLSWWRIAQDLIDCGWQVQALDLLGHGDRRHAGGGSLTIADLAYDVMQQAPGPVDLVAGHSLGAIVALTVVQLDPDYTAAIVIEEPPGLAGSLDPRDVADNIERSVCAARADPEGAVAALLGENRFWSRIDAENAVASRVSLDVEHVAGLLRNDRWDLQALVAGCPVPLHLLAATNDTGLVEPDRTAVMKLLPEMQTSVIESGHSIHRDRPGLWLHEVLKFADRNAGVRTR